MVWWPAPEVRRSTRRTSGMSRPLKKRSCAGSVPDPIWRTSETGRWSSFAVTGNRGSLAAAKEVVGGHAKHGHDTAGVRRRTGPAPFPVSVKTLSGPLEKQRASLLPDVHLCHGRARQGRDWQGYPRLSLRQNRMLFPLTVGPLLCKYAAARRRVDPQLGDEAAQHDLAILNRTQFFGDTP